VTFSPAGSPPPLTPGRLSAIIRALDPQLPGPVWRLETGGLVSAFGNGLVLPFTMIYLHNVRGISLATAGLILATFAAVSFAVTLPAGTLVDRLGARGGLALALVVSAVGYGLLPLVREPWQGFAVIAVAGAGNGLFWPSHSTLLYGLAPADRRHMAIALHRAVYNLGIGLGAAVGGTIAMTSDPKTFSALFLLDAATFVVFAAWLGRVPRPAVVAADVEAAGPAERDAGYARVLRDRVFVAILALNVALVLAGWALFESVLPVFAMNEIEVGETVIGLYLTANVVVYVFLQLVVARLLEGKSRMRALALLAVIWIAVWFAVFGAGSWLAGAAAGAAVLVAAAMLFAVGECIQGPVQSALVADLAPERLRGRYMALMTNTYAIGFTLGPALGGYVLDVEPLALWPLAAALLAVVAVAALAVERMLPEELRRTPATPPTRPRAA
jgi:MFS family permease